MRMVFPSPASGRLMDELATDVGTLVESFFGEATDRGRAARQNRMPVPMDIDETDDAYQVTLDVPGVPIESIAIDVHENTLTISGQRVSGANAKSDEEAAENGSAAENNEGAASTVKRHRRERPSGKFERKLELPLAIESDAVTANLSDGVLVVWLPKADPEKGKRRIPVTKR
ncbi:18 kDa heat shock protein [Stieleria maiorica]|uniref:18 kDa heat shock protein n=1 Tax=Stieleria maiorica TaxID=2795974 RepID=A0A5B9MRY3_9BACT|nr:Hsp20/alpha crystallin family protein [Stieleria maiorica]QEG02685.1 18 kDa heat shock protein [Stieleria maiorica]